MSVYQFQRSTKGASKQRRENINSEIGVIRDLLPVQEAIRKRLSQLQVMALCKAFIGKSNAFSKLPKNEFSLDVGRTFDFVQTVSGFLLMTTTSGRILYISENVMEFLGHSMVDVMTQSETIFELVESGDQQLFENIFYREEPREENSAPLIDHVAASELNEEKLVTFSCRMGMLRHARRNPNFDRYKKMRICGRFVQIAGSDPCDRVFVALCSPRLNQVMVSEPSSIFDTMVYQSVHRLDMKFINLDQNGQFHLGYSQEEMQSKSWYELIHPEDVMQAAKKHKELIQATNSDAVYSLCVRMQTRSGDLIWVQMIMQKSVWQSSSSTSEQSEPLISCINHVVSEADAINDEKEEEQVLMNPVNFSGSYTVESPGNKSTFSAVAVETVVEEVPQPDRAEVLRRLKRKMTSKDKKNKAARYSDDTASVSSGSVSLYPSDDMISPYSNSSAYSENSLTSPKGCYVASSPAAIVTVKQIPISSSSYASMLGSLSENSITHGMISEELLLLSEPTPERNQNFCSPVHENQSFYEDMAALPETEIFDEASSFFIPSLKPKQEQKRSVEIQNNASDLPELDSGFLVDFFYKLEEFPIETKPEIHEVFDLENSDVKNVFEASSEKSFAGNQLECWSSSSFLEENNLYLSNPFQDASQNFSAGRMGLTWVY